MSQGLASLAVVLSMVASFVQGSPTALAGKWKIPGADEAGTWYLVLSADGKSEVIGDGQTQVNGRYTAKDGEFAVTDVSGLIACVAPETATGTYKYTLDEKQLKLELVKDECPGRRRALSSKPLERVQ
jgi:hypothetical protein